jgi:hypothetical protein
MRTRSKAGFFAVAAAALVLLVPPAAGADGAAQFRHGIGIDHAMAWARVEPGPAHSFAFPPFSDPDNALTRASLQTLRRTGFDSVRLAVDPGPFLQFQGERRDALDRLLLDRINLIVASGLSVIVDLHPSDIQPDYIAEKLTGGRDTPLFRAYLQMLARMAAVLEGLHSQQVALELMNEPPVPQAVWQPMLETAYAAARSRAPDLVLVLEGGDEASVPALLAMGTAPFAADPAVLFSFHYYDPYQFTHQGASWNAARYLADVPYPARARPLDDSLAATAAAITASDLAAQQRGAAYLDAEQRLQRYRQSNFNADTIAATFAQVAAWGRAHGIPADRILLGEFGAIKTVFQNDGGIRAAERAQWFHDVSRTAEQQGFPWAVWGYRRGSFALARDETADEIDPAIATALGLLPKPAELAAPALHHAQSESH